MMIKIRSADDIRAVARKARARGYKVLFHHMENWSRPLKTEKGAVNWWEWRRRHGLLSPYGHYMSAELVDCKGCTHGSFEDAENYGA